MFRSATCARIIPKEFSEKYLYHWIKNISFLFIPLSVSHSAAGSSHSIEMSSLHNNFHFNDTTFKIYCIHWALYSCCHTSHLSHSALFLNIILKHYFGTLFRSIIFAPALPFPASLQQIVNHHNWCLFIILYSFHNATDFVNSQLSSEGILYVEEIFKHVLHNIAHLHIDRAEPRVSFTKYA